MLHTHKFAVGEIEVMRKQLLSFYDAKKRNLPWRHLAASLKDDTERAYSVWVSEIMLQQTQVATVIDYYNKWMKKWPTVADLAKASLEEVNEMWSGLGYYSRGRRLLEGAQKIINGNGEMPTSCKELIKELPGVGRYTAGAIASIAYKEVTGVVDGNVIRVLSRMKLIGADSSSQSAVDLFWELANTIVDDKRPGDFNQAMMELGATICTPKSPDCTKCPLNNICKAYARVKNKNEKTQSRLSINKTECNNNKTTDINILKDIEDVMDCKYCLPSDQPYDDSLGVMNYPRKAKKKPPKQEKYISIMLQKEQKYLLSKRPEKGLLAGLWEFPLVLLELDSKNKNHNALLQKELKQLHDINDVTNIKYIGEVVHIFSHIHHTYCVYHAKCKPNVEESSVEDNICWMEADDIMTKSAVSTAIKKIYRLYENHDKPLSNAKSSKRKRMEEGDKKQRSIESMFKKKVQKVKEE